MSQAVVYSLIPNFKFDGFQTDLQTSCSITICRNPHNILSKLLNDSKKYISTINQDRIDNIRCVLTVETDDNNESINNGINKIEKFIALMRIVKPVVAYPQYCLSYHRAGDYYSIRRLDTRKVCYAIDSNTEMHKITIDKIPVLESMWINLQKIAKTNQRIWGALWLHEKAYYENYHEFRILNFAIALESLFGTSDAELRYSISLRCARFLSDDSIKRREIFEDVLYAYNIRSNIVHGLRKKIKKPELKKAEICLRENVRNCLIRILKDPNLINKFDGSKKIYNEFVKDLVLLKDIEC